ncbi:hypothetical protein AFLA70_4g008061 [Aspergillus flavus AF70]|nr:hypothetical protein AFLA70_4g008061 [Aspergillus flavus AF70]
MSGVELGLAIIGTLDLCLKYGQIIVTKYKTFNKADEEIEERILAIEAAWAKISQQLAFLKRVWASLDEDYQELQGRILRVLERKLQTAVLQISKFEKGANQTGTGFTDKRKALKYALMVKGSLDKAI